MCFWKINKAINAINYIVCIKCNIENGHEGLKHKKKT